MAVRCSGFGSGPGGLRRDLNMENRIKEQQLMLFADRTSAATMRASQLRLYCSSVAYLLLQALRRIAPVGTALAHPQCQTIRLTLLKIGVRIRITARHEPFQGALTPKRALAYSAFHSS